MEDDDDMWFDEVGRSFCKAHRREVCHDCGFVFDFMNRQTEIHAGLRKAPSRAEELARDRVDLQEGIRFIEEQVVPAFDEFWARP